MEGLVKVSRSGTHMYMYCMQIRSCASSNELSLQSFPHLFHVYIITLNVHSVYQCVPI